MAKFFTSFLIALAGLFGAHLQQVPSPVPASLVVVSVSPEPTILVTPEPTPTPTPRPRPVYVPRATVVPVPTYFPEPTELPVSSTDIDTLLLLEQLKLQMQEINQRPIYQSPTYQSPTYNNSYDSYQPLTLPTYSTYPSPNPGFTFTNDYDSLSNSYNLQYNSGGTTQYGTGYHDPLTNSDHYSIGGTNTNCYQDQLTHTYNCSGN